MASVERTIRPKPTCLGVLLLLALPLPLDAQDGPGSARATARQFYDAISSTQWAAVAALVHPEQLAVVRDHLRLMIQADSSGAVLTELLQLSDRRGFDFASDEQVFERVLRALERRITPLAQVLSTNEVEIVGSVPDGRDAHVVVRVTPYADGPRPTWVRVLTLRPDGQRWRVLESEELKSIVTAVLGLPLNRTSRHR
jgi:hypothetical protein